VDSDRVVFQTIPGGQDDLQYWQLNPLHDDGAATIIEISSALHAEEKFGKGLYLFVCDIVHDGSCYAVYQGHPSFVDVPRRTPGAPSSGTELRFVQFCDGDVKQIVPTQSSAPLVDALIHMERSALVTHPSLIRAQPPGSLRLLHAPCSAVRCGAVRCGAVRCGAVRRQPALLMRRMQARCEQHDSNMDFVQAVQFDGALLGVRGGMRTVPCWARSRRILKSNARQDFFHRGDDQTPAHHRVFRIGA
jgi:hypothetical protein